MATTYIDSDATVFGFGTTSGSTPTFTQGSTDRYIFGGVGVVNFGAFTIDQLKYGGSGGTTLPAIVSDQAFYAGAGLLRAGDIAPGPSGTSDVYGAVSASLQVGVGGVAYDGVDQTTPLSDATSASGIEGGVTTEIASVVIPNCTSGQTVVAFVYAASESFSITSFTAITGTTIRAQALGGSGEEFAGVAILEKVAASSGSITIEVNCNCASSGAIAWAISGGRINEAAGGASTVTAATGAATSSAMAGESTAETAQTAAAGVATASAITGRSTFRADMTQAAGAATASTRTASSTAEAAVTQASGAATASTQAGESTAESAFAQADGVATASTLASGAGPSTITSASGSATSSTMAGEAVAVAAFVAANGIATAESLPGFPPLIEAVTSGAPGGRPWIAYINGRRVTGSLWELQRLIEELAEEQAEKAVEKGEEPKKPRIVVQPGKAIAKMPEVNQEQGKAIQQNIRTAYNEAYIKAKIKFSEHEAEEEATMMVLLS